MKRYHKLYLNIGKLILLPTHEVLDLFFFLVQKNEMCGCSVFAFDKMVLDNMVFWLGSSEGRASNSSLNFLFIKHMCAHALALGAFMYVYIYAYI